ncbi:16S rRNA (guanine(527)-N(7))-methyltransferase RsmG [Glacieibacterium frigidum]|uniref:Ribosomal RNA small subunit methyltransferase G n=1 Tax=Glacieibacterium frigidum TaxID=2593303 RepID=A0A552UA15_9SPHN|nr:16S rRNA (guanine(527)-N(7))-methyltransferase RsmG [Glacieibacterium frigidum]TRW15055.1 16S rRNA (guanine(527)-N(7))-methyltransferase RsmG [Glacieibacterium frigidum]
MLVDVSRETYGADQFAEQFDVSRETLACFETYAAMLAEWQGRMNLVGPATLAQTWERHFADSAQLVPLGAAPWLDLGAGAGLPGLVIALLGGGPVDLVEATGKKTEFLAAVAEATGIADQVRIHRSRIEAMPLLQPATIVARACASLSQLFDWGIRFAGPTTRWVLPKGARAADEIAEARLRFRFDHDLVPSVTDAQARIVVATNVRRR